MFSGCGALGLESISRGAAKAYLCDISPRAIKVIKQNVEKVHCEDKTFVLQSDYQKALERFKENNIKFDVIFLDPPYKTEYTIKSVKQILDNDLLNEDGIVIVETDIEKEILSGLNELSVDIYDVRKYGRVTLIFIRRKG